MPSSKEVPFWSWTSVVHHNNNCLLPRQARARACTFWSLFIFVYYAGRHVQSSCSLHTHLLVAKYSFKSIWTCPSRMSGSSTSCRDRNWKKTNKKAVSSTMVHNLAMHEVPQSLPFCFNVSNEQIVVLFVKPTSSLRFSTLQEGTADTCQLRHLPVASYSGTGAI